MRMKKTYLILVLLSSLGLSKELLVKLTDTDAATIKKFTAENGGSLTLVSRAGKVFLWTKSSSRLDGVSIASLVTDKEVVAAQENNTISLLSNPSLEENRVFFQDALRTGSLSVTDDAFVDNPDFVNPTHPIMGADSLLSKQWGFTLIGAFNALKVAPQGKDIVVAVTDSGVDYTHEDLINSMWRNPGEIPGNDKDDDHNGFVDDIVGWDFARKDNKPYDLMLTKTELLTKGGNPGHGTHVSGVIAADHNNSLGISGIAPKAKIMALRFIDESARGSTADAIGAIDYAVENGAKVINASWGGESANGQENPLLVEAIERARDKGVLFIAAAGNGRYDKEKKKAIGFNNDEDPHPVMPASVKLDNVFTVAAIDKDGSLGVFSNFGGKSVRVGAPGVKILSTVPGSKYEDTVLQVGTKSATWDGTSMAAPHVAGAAAAIWSMDPSMSYKEVEEAILSLSVNVSVLQNKVSSNGRLDLAKLR